MTLDKFIERYDPVMGYVSGHDEQIINQYKTYENDIDYAHSDAKAFAGSNDPLKHFWSLSIENGVPVLKNGLDMKCDVVAVTKNPWTGQPNEITVLGITPLLGYIRPKRLKPQKLSLVATAALLGF